MTLLSVLANLNNSVVWMASARPLISKSSSPCINLWVIVRRVPITIGITVSFMFHSFFNSSNKVQVFILLFTSFQFYSVVSQDSKVHNSVSSLFFFFFSLLIIIRSGRLVARLSDPLVCQNSWGVSASHFLGSADTICSNDQTLISGTFLSGSPCLPSCV